jgi:hypothetical protein
MRWAQPARERPIEEAGKNLKEATELYLEEFPLRARRGH